MPGFEEEFDFDGLCERMVRTQLKARGIADPRLLDAFRAIPRHRFVDPGHWDEAYEDHPVPIEKGQTISQPYVVAYMTELLAVEEGMRVLEVGTGSGYQAAILAHLGATVHTVERHEALTARAAAAIEETGYGDRVVFHIGDGSLGLPEEAPFDRIIVTAAAPAVPEALKDELSTRGGRLVIPVGRSHQRLVLCIREGETCRQEESLPVIFVPLIGENAF
ncbi:MAG: protein-L-isoaspartate(D-aspartate) O-methyltransferase [Planctomycetota bacterium]